MARRPGAMQRPEPSRARLPEPERGDGARRADLLSNAFFDPRICSLSSTRFCVRVREDGVPVSHAAATRFGVSRPTWYQAQRAWIGKSGLCGIAAGPAGTAPAPQAQLDEVPSRLATGGEASNMSRS